MLSKIKKIQSFLMLIFSVTFLINCGSSLSNKTLRIEVTNENGENLKGTDIVIQKDSESRNYKTIEGGRITIERVYKPPFTLFVNYPENNLYHPDTLKISENDFGEMSTISREIELIKKKTVIKGRVIDKETTKAIPAVTVKLKPLSVLYTQTNKEGNFELKSARIEEGVQYTVHFERKVVENKEIKPYSKNIDNLEIFSINNLGDIELESEKIPESELQEHQQTNPEGGGSGATWE